VSADAEIVIGAKDQASSVLRGVGSNISSLAGGLKAFGPVAIGAAAAFAQITAGVVAFNAASSAILDRAKEIDALAKAATRVGESVGDLQAFQFALGEVAGASAETAQQALAELRKSIGEAVGGGAKGTLLEQMGLDAKSLSQAGTVAAFGQVRDALSKIENGAQRAAMAEQLLGGEARKLMGLLGDQSDAFMQSMIAAEELGLTITDGGAAGVEAMNDALGRASAVFDGLVTQATVELAPAIEMIAERFIAIGEVLETGDFDDWVQGGTALAGVTYDILNNIAQVVDALRFIQSLGTQGDLSLDFSSGTGGALVTELMEKQARNAQSAIDKAVARAKAQRESLDLTNEEAAVEEKKATEADKTIEALNRQLAILEMGRDEYERMQQLATATTEEERKRIEALQSQIRAREQLAEQEAEQQRKQEEERRLANALANAPSGITATQGRLITRGNAGNEQLRIAKSTEASLDQLRQIRETLERDRQSGRVEFTLVGGGA